jgi:FkbM family methyltransferase
MTKHLFSLFFELYRWFLARPALRRFNLHCFKLTLRPLGLLNSETAQATGESAWLTQLAKTNQIKTIIDVGANDAAYGAQEFPNATIYAFEPHPVSYERLKKHAGANVHPVHAAVGAKSATAKLWDFAADAPLKATQPTSQLASLHKTVITQLHGQPATSYPVTITTLDSFAQKHRISHIDLLKIDAEGNELAVLEGAQQLIAKKRISIIQFEFNEMMAYSHTHFLDFVTLLPDYTFYRLLPDGLLPLGPYRPLTHELYGFQNVVAVHSNIKLA